MRLQTTSIVLKKIKSIKQLLHPFTKNNVADTEKNDLKFKIFLL